MVNYRSCRKNKHMLCKIDKYFIEELDYSMYNFDVIVKLKNALKMELL